MFSNDGDRKGRWDTIKIAQLRKRNELALVSGDSVETDSYHIASQLSGLTC